MESEFSLKKTKFYFVLVAASMVYCSWQVVSEVWKLKKEIEDWTNEYFHYLLSYEMKYNKCLRYNSLVYSVVVSLRKEVIWSNVHYISVLHTYYQLIHEDTIICICYLLNNFFILFCRWMSTDDIDEEFWNLEIQEMKTEVDVWVFSFFEEFILNNVIFDTYEWYIIDNYFILLYIFDGIIFH